MGRRGAAERAPADPRRGVHPPAGGDAYGTMDKQIEQFQKLPGPAIVVFQDLDSPSISATFGEVMCSVYQGFGSTGLITSGTGRDLEQVKALKYPVFTVMLIAFLVTLGAFSYRGLAVDLFPKADPATVNVDVQLPGATPEEVVTGVVLPLEDAISSVSGIDEITVYASEGYADITCTFVLERDIDGAAQDVREKVSAAINRLPRETLPPVITKEDPQSDPILTILVSGLGGWLLAWNFLDYPLTLHGLGVRARLAWCLRNFSAFTMFGVTWALLLIVPGLFFFILPMGVAGATRLIEEFLTQETGAAGTPAKTRGLAHKWDSISQIVVPPRKGVNDYKTRWKFRRCGCGPVALGAGVRRKR